MKPRAHGPDSPDLSRHMPSDGIVAAPVRLAAGGRRRGSPAREPGLSHHVRCILYRTSDGVTDGVADGIAGAADGASRPPGLDLKRVAVRLAPAPPEPAR